MVSFSSFTNGASRGLQDVQDLTKGFQHMLDNVKEEMSAPVDTAEEARLLQQRTAEGTAAAPGSASRSAPARDAASRTAAAGSADGGPSGSLADSNEDSELDTGLHVRLCRFRRGPCLCC